MAGTEGALLTQTNQFVGLLLFLIAQDYLARQFSEDWYFGIGLILVLVVLFARGGILRISDAIIARIGRKS